jgi:hypothetical protein
MKLENKILHVVNQFDPISLEEMDSVRLMRRIDSKYALPVSQLPVLLEMALPGFRMVEIEGYREQIYETTYFDTNDFSMYHIHHNGKLNRHKIRLRKYIYSKQEFLEVKRKNNKGETIKTRIGKHPNIHLINSDINTTFLNKYTPYNPDTLTAVLGNRFIRLTLVNKNFKERITLDYNIEFTNLLDGQEKTFPGICIAEVKCNRDDRHSAFTSLINFLRINQIGFSKYCIGMAMLNTDVKDNLFKPRINTLKKISINN